MNERPRTPDDALSPADDEATLAVGEPHPTIHGLLLDGHDDPIAVVEHLDSPSGAVRDSSEPVGLAPDEPRAQLLRELSEAEAEVAALMRERAAWLNERHQLERTTVRAQREATRERERVSELERTVSTEQSQRLSLEKELRGVRNDHAREVRQASALKRERAAQPTTGLQGLFSSPKARHWVGLHRRTLKFSIAPYVASAGHGPLDSSQVTRLVKTLGASSTDAGDGSAEILILGRDEVFIDDIEAQIRARSGRILRIYSQEMFLAAHVLGSDPYDTADTATLRSFADRHPGLQLLLTFGFEWPTTSSRRLAKSLVDLDLEVEESPPHRMGYVVGRTAGVSEKARRDVLRRAFANTLPSVASPRYMRGWGSPGSATRLRRMSRHIAWLVRTRRGLPTLGQARNEWSDDLTWMRENLYEPWMGFRWPGSTID